MLLTVQKLPPAFAALSPAAACSCCVMECLLAATSLPRPPPFSLRTLNTLPSSQLHLPCIGGHLKHLNKISLAVHARWAYSIWDRSALPNTLAGAPNRTSGAGGRVVLLPNLRCFLPVASHCLSPKGGSQRPYRAARYKCTLRHRTPAEARRPLPHTLTVWARREMSGCNPRRRRCRCCRHPPSCRLPWAPAVGWSSRCGQRRPARAPPPTWA